MRPEDEAQLLEMAERNNRIKQVRDRVAKAAELSSAEFCMNKSCGEAIPEARRLAYPGVQLCIRCKSIGEKFGRLP